MYRLATNVNDRHRRLRRNARDVAPDKLIEHNVAEHNDLAIAHRSKQLLGSLSC
jgi:hypothetical protein